MTKPRYLVCLGILACLMVAPALGHAPSGAIFTTVADGSEVNFNIYPSKEAVYLDGGPGPGAPQHAAALDDGDYYFQVTDPPGKTLLSTDDITCRRFTVTNGVITSVANSDPSCAHQTGIDQDHAESGAITVQLFPFKDTPNPGGVYKVWVTFVEDYGAGNCKNPRKACNIGKFGFVPSHSKTDNFKVRVGAPVEIDTRFFRDENADGIFQWGEPWMDGFGITWIDPLGGSNQKWSMYAPEIQVYHEAHVEAVENGTHTIRVYDQLGCTIGGVHVDGEWAPVDGPQDVLVDIQASGHEELTIFVDVGCLPQ
jgi:hypothetical protein